MRNFALLLLLLAATPACAAEAEMMIAAPAATDDPAPVAEPAPLPAPALAKKWEMIAEKSSITFHGKQMGTEFDGFIKFFTPEIYFDESNLEQSKVIVDIDINSIDAKDAERNKSIKGPDWFKTDEFPTARFESEKFAKTGENAFTADATLTIRGVAVPVQFPFTLTHQAVGFGQDRAIVTGSVTLDRSKFQLGQGDWADPSVIANEVQVDVKVTTIPASK